MKRLILAGLALAVPAAGQQVAQQAALPGAPKVKKTDGPAEVSRNAPVNGVLTLFGNERCPTDNQGNEIVVCVRRGANERFRVPKELRELQVTEQNRAWAEKAKATLAEGTDVSSIGSCSVTGPGGQAGCMTQQFRAARAENKQREADKPDLP